MQLKLVCLSFIVMCVYSTGLKAQSKEQQLILTILHLDSVFWNTYNHCDTAGFKRFISDDVEFYHDKGGITAGAFCFNKILAGINR